MVLDTVEEVTENNQAHGYEIGDHKLIFKNTYDSEEYGKEKKFTINANDPNTPDSFYYVHIDVDLDQIKDCTCQERYCKCPEQYQIYFSELEIISDEEPYNESACTQCLDAFKSCFNC